MPITSWIRDHIAALRDGMPEFNAGAKPISIREMKLAAEDRDNTAIVTEYERFDLYASAAAATYASGRVKRTRFPKVDLTKRRVVIVLHQTGAERKDSSTRWKLVTAHRVITPAGRRLLLHPLTTRLVAANGFDRAPWHGISIEVAGSFEGVDGEGNWYRPDMFGRGRMSDAQKDACLQEVAAICHDVKMAGARVVAIAPHRVSGRDSRGRPNRPLCPGSRVWIEVGERAAQLHGLAIPKGKFSLGGTPLPDSWKGPLYATARDMADLK